MNGFKKYIAFNLHVMHLIKIWGHLKPLFWVRRFNRLINVAVNRLFLVHKISGFIPTQANCSALNVVNSLQSLRSFQLIVLVLSHMPKYSLVANHLFYDLKKRKQSLRAFHFSICIAYANYAQNFRRNDVTDLEFWKALISECYKLQIHFSAKSKKCQLYNGTVVVYLRNVFG